MPRRVGAPVQSGLALGLALVLAALLAAPAGGCSFAFVTPQRTPRRPAAAPCTRSRVAPITDFALAVGLATAGGVTLSQLGPCIFQASDQPDRCGVSKGAALILLPVSVVALVAAWIHLVSGVYGADAVATCRERGASDRAP